VSAEGAPQKAAWHFPLRQTAPLSQGQPQTTRTESRAPDPSGVLATAALNWAMDPTLIAEPPQVQVAAEQ
jgi:hypothetical protein